jgi:hypothetical protein
MSEKKNERPNFSATWWTTRRCLNVLKKGTMICQSEESGKWFCAVPLNQIRGSFPFLLFPQKMLWNKIESGLNSLSLHFTKRRDVLSETLSLEYLNTKYDDSNGHLDLSNIQLDAQYLCFVMCLLRLLHNTRRSVTCCHTCAPNGHLQRVVLSQPVHRTATWRYQMLY